MLTTLTQLNGSNLVYVHEADVAQLLVGLPILNQYLWLMNYSKHSLISGKTVSQAANIIVIGSESL